VLLGAALEVTGQPLAAARGEGWRLVVLGMAGYGLEAGLFFGAVRHGSAATATLLFFTYPAIVTLLAAVTGAGLPGKLVVVALCSSVVGAALVVVAGHGLAISGLGVLLALAAALAAAAAVSGTGDWPVGLRQWGPVLGLAASVLAVIFLHESLGAAAVVGGTLILAGAVTASLARRHRPPDPP